MSSRKTLWNKSRNSGFSYQRCLDLCGQDLQLPPMGLCIFIHHLGAGQIGLQGPFSSAHSVTVLVLCTAMCNWLWLLRAWGAGRREGAGKGNRTGCSLEGGAWLLYCVCSSKQSCLGLLTEMILPGFSGDRFLSPSFPCYHFNIKDTQTRRSDSPTKWEKGHLKVAFLCLKSGWKTVLE